MLFQFFVMGTMFANLSNENNSDPAFLFNYIQLLPILTIVFMGVLWLWFWSVATGLQSKVPEGVTMKIKKFKIFFFIPLIYILFFVGIFMTVITGESSIPIIFAVIFPLHIFSMFCIFYTLYFIAKTFKTVELQREVRFSDFAGEFFLIWFYPIGIWILQPKINKMVEE